MSHNHSSNCKCKSTTAAQNLMELDFDRGIWSAALYNEIDRLRSLISKGHLHDKDNSGYTALHYAARSGHLDVCKLLINEGINVDEKTNGGATALHRAAMAGRDMIVDLLILKKCDLTAKDSDGKSALHRAAENGHLKICEKLLQNCSNLKYDKDAKGHTPLDLIPATSTCCIDLKLVLN